MVNKIKEIRYREVDTYYRDIINNGVWFFLLEMH